MSSYTKRMMEAAARWLAANPDQDCPLIHIPLAADEPSLETIRDLEAKAKARQPERWASPDIQAGIAAVYKAFNDTAERRRLLAGSMNSLAQPCSLMWDLGSPDPRHHELATGGWLVRWARDGFNVFDLSADFVAAMLLTDPSALDLSDLRLPFRGLLIMIPDRFATGHDGKHFTKVHVAEVPQVATADQDGEPVLTKEVLGRLIDIKATDGHRWAITTVRSDELTALGIGAIDDLPKLVDPASTAGRLTDAGTGAAADDQVLTTVQRVVLGTLAYLANTERSMERREAPRRGRQRDTEARPVFWDVARTVRIDPRLVQAARAGSREVALRIKHRHIVRGHYRNQPHGEGRRERKHIWICPFWRGPEDGAQIVHTYKPASPTDGTT